MKKLILMTSICLCLFAGCATKQQPVGSDRDAHGCIPSAGYSWCERTKQCERPWELAEDRGFENTQEAFDSFCKN